MKVSIEMSSHFTSKQTRLRGKTGKQKSKHEVSGYTRMVQTTWAVFCEHAYVCSPKDR